MTNNNTKTCKLLDKFFTCHFSQNTLSISHKIRMKKKVRKNTHNLFNKHVPFEKPNILFKDYKLTTCTELSESLQI